MPDLVVQVRLPDLPSATYRFDRPVIRLGRTPECDLCLLHAAVPRELGRAFLDDDGSTIRVEPAPALKNPILHRGQPVRGGIGGERLELSIGPVELTFFSAPADRPIGDPTRLPTRRLLRSWPLAAAALLALVGALLWPHAERAQAPGVDADLPDPFDVPSTQESPRSIDVWIRAEQTLMSNAITGHEAARALAVLDRAARRLATADARLADRISRLAATGYQRWRERFGQARLGLERASRLGDQAERRIHAAVLCAFYPQPDPRPAVRRLCALAERHGSVAPTGKERP